MINSQIIDKVVSLPVEERAELIDLLLQSLNQPETNIDEKWKVIAKKRFDDYKSGKVKAIPGDEVFDKISKKYNK